MLSVRRRLEGRSPPAGRGSPPIREETAYEPLFNQPRRETDARGQITEHIFDYQEGSRSALRSLLETWGIDDEILVDGGGPGPSVIKTGTARCR